MAGSYRKPTGLPSWPMTLLAGREKAGKSYGAIKASASPMLGRTIYLGLGENDPDEYALIPGAEFDIAEHEGTYPSFLQAVRDAVAEPSVGGKPTLLVFDSATRLWNLIQDNLQAIANKRANGRRTASGDYSISTDLWNVGAGWWQDVMDALRAHKGPVIITARLDEVAVMEGGAPAKSGAKQWKVQAHKSLPFDVDAVIEMHERGHFLLTGVRSVRIKLEKPTPVPEFSIEWLWDRLGLAEGTSDRTHATVRVDQEASPLDAIAAASTLAELQGVWMALQKAGVAKQPELIAAKDARKVVLQGASAPAAPAEAPVATESPTQPEAAPSDAAETQEEYEARIAAEFDAIADAEAAGAGAQA